MTMKFRHILVMVFAIFAFCRCGDETSHVMFPVNVDEALGALENTLDRQDEIFEKRDLLIDSLKSALPDAGKTDSLRLYTEISKAYMHFQIDSFVRYSDLAIMYAESSGRTDLAKSLELHKMESYPLQLKLAESVEFLESADPLSMSYDNKVLYFEVARKMYLYFTTLQSSGDLYRGYINKLSSYNDSLLKILPPSHPHYKLYLGSHYVYAGELPLSIAILSEQLAGMSITDNKYPDVASMLGLAYFLRGREPMWRYAMTLVAISETELGMRDGEVLRRLASGYYNVGNQDFAYRLMIESDKNLAASGAIIRSVHISEDIPAISDAYLSSQRASRLRLYIIMLCLVAFSALWAVLLYSKFKDKKRLDRMAYILEKANKTKDVYLGQFLELSSTYVDKMVDFNQLVSRKLASGRVEELMHLIKTEKIIDEQRRMFYDIFDEAFMQIYPNFIRDVNLLLIPEERFEVEDGFHLTPELRILALMRMGLESSVQVARFLGLSVNTVYTYKNRIRGKALNRDTFDDDVVAIGIPTV